MPRTTQPKPKPRAPPLSSATCRASSSAMRRAWIPFKIATPQRLNAGAFACACCASMPRARCATPRPRSAAQERFRSRLRTWAAAPDAAQAPAFSAWGSRLRAAPVSWRPCARDGLLPPSRGSCARTVFHTPCGASITKNALALHLLLEGPENLIDIVVANEYLQNVSNLRPAPDAPMAVALNAL